MTTTAAPAWEAKRTDETRRVEDALRAAGFERVDAYRYNIAAIRVRVVDPRFAGMPREKRYDLVEPYLDQLPERTQADILTLLIFAPEELQEQGPNRLRDGIMNAEFDDPSPSML